MKTLQARRVKVVLRCKSCRHERNKRVMGNVAADGQQTCVSLYNLVLNGMA
jgi:hypothetical protein